LDASVAAADPPADASQPRRAILISLMLAAFGFIGALDQNVIVTALPRMLGDTGAPILLFSLHGSAALQFDRAGWLVTGYLLGYVAVLPLMGAVSDVHGRRQIMILALLIFLGGSVAAAMANTLPVLVVARTVQALGAGAFLPVALAAAADLVGAPRLGLALGLIAAAAELGGVCGPLYGAFVTEHSDAGWRMIFWLNVPIVALLLPLTLFLPAGRRLRPVDYRGGLVLGLALAGLVIGCSSSGAFATGLGGGSANRWFLVLSVALLVLLWRLQRGISMPILPRPALRSLQFAAACLVNLLVGVALGVAIVSVPIYATTVLADSAVQGGLLLLRYLIPLAIGAALGGWLCDRFGARLVAVIGLLVAAAGYWQLRGWLVIPPHAPALLPPVVAGLGIGLVAAPVTSAALGVSGHDHGGVLASLITAARVIGTMVGLSALTSWSSWRFQQISASVPLPHVSAHAGLSGFQHAMKAYGIAMQGKEIVVLRDDFVLAAAGLALAVLPALLLRRVPASRPDTRAQDSAIIRGV
jgi:MFS family permease